MLLIDFSSTRFSRWRMHTTACTARYIALSRGSHSLSISRRSSIRFSWSSCSRFRPRQTANDPIISMDWQASSSVSCLANAVVSLGVWDMKLVSSISLLITQCPGSRTYICPFEVLLRLWLSIWPCTTAVTTSSSSSSFSLTLGWETNS